MNKNLLMIAALALSASAVFAQDATLPSYKVVPAEGEWTGETLIGTSTFEFKQDVKVYQAVAMSGAYGMGDFQVINLDMTTATPKVEVPIDESCWGDPVMDVFYLTIMFPEVYDADDNLIMDGEDPWMPTASYQCVNSFPARFLHAVPDPKAFSAAGAYDNSVVSFLYSQEIALSDASECIIAYDYKGRLLEKEVPSTELVVSQDEFTGVWNVMVPVQNDEISGEGTMPKEEDLASMTIYLSGVLAVETKDEVYTPEIVFEQYSPLGDDVMFKAPAKKSQQTGMTLINSQEEVSVFNLQGMCVNKNLKVSELSNLPSGIYVVNGKKLVIK